MIRMSEMVLPGHPDKVCDQIADAVIAACVEVDADAYGQIEAGIWCDQLWLSGGVCTRLPLRTSLEDLARKTLREIGYLDQSRRCQIVDTVCQDVGDPKRWSNAVNDQAIVAGWAGYDLKTRGLPPEHFLCHLLREALALSCSNGALAGHGPDGKILVRLREDSGGFFLEQILVTLQQKPGAEFIEVCLALSTLFRVVYTRLRSSDARWAGSWEEVELLINPNGPLLNGGSEGDNGQTGRKLVMDFYGPRVPIGGGALSGKHLSHIDRIGSYAAREAALHALATGAQECLVRVAYAPGRTLPLEVTYEMLGRGERYDEQWFDHRALRERYSTQVDYRALAQGTHFFDPEARWNSMQRSAA
jgi:S-adenosylmethionine synthetase